MFELDSLLGNDALMSEHCSHCQTQLPKSTPFNVTAVVPGQTKLLRFCDEACRKEWLTIEHCLWCGTSREDVELTVCRNNGTGDRYYCDFTHANEHDQWSRVGRGNQ